MATEPAWTETNLAALERAIARGIRAAEYQGERVEYRSLDEMISLRDRMQQALGQVAPQPLFGMVRVATRKGL